MSNREDHLRESLNLLEVSVPSVQANELFSHDESLSKIEDVELTLPPLFNFMDWLTARDIIELSKELIVSSEQLSNDALAKLKVVKDSSADSKKKLLSVFVSCLKDEAKQGWRIDLLKALQEIELFSVHDVLKCYFEDAIDQIRWLMDNWALLRNRKDLCEIAKKINLKEPRVDPGENLLLYYVHEAILKGEDFLKKFVDALNHIEVDFKQLEVHPGSHCALKDRVDSLLKPTLPMLKASLSDKQFMALMRELVVSEYFSKDMYQEYKSQPLVADKENAAERFLCFFTNEAKTNWKEALLHAIAERDLTLLRDVMECYFENPASLTWFLGNWDQLQSKKEMLLTTAQILSLNIHITTEHWLLSYVNQVVKLGDNHLQSLITALSDENGKVKETIENLSNDSNDKDVITANATEANDQFSKEICDTMEPLASILSYSLSSKQLLDITKDLYMDENFSKGSIEELKSYTLTTSDRSDTVLLFISLWAKDAKSDWKTSFVGALENENLTAVHSVFRNYLFNPNKFLEWTLLRWIEWVDKQERIIAVAHSLGLCTDVSADSELSLLHVMVSLMHCNEEMQEKFITDLQAAVLVETKQDISENLAEETRENVNVPEQSDHVECDGNRMEQDIQPEEEQMEVDEPFGAGDATQVLPKVVVEQPRGKATDFKEVEQHLDQKPEEFEILEIDWEPTEGQYKMEFQVVLDSEYALPKDAALMLFVLNRGSFRMSFNSKWNIFRYALSLSTDNFRHVYKYFIRTNAGDKWEVVPFYKKTWNRTCSVDADQVASGYAVTFDAIFFEEKSENEFKKSFKTNLTTLAPSYELVAGTTESENVIGVLFNLYEQWVKNFFRKKELCDESGKPLKCTGPPGTDEVLAQHVKLEAGKNEANRITECICLCRAAYGRKLTNELKIDFCLGLSVDVLDENQFKSFKSQLRALNQYFKNTEFAGDMTFESSLKHMVSSLANVPHFLLVLPLLKLAENRDHEFPPVVPAWYELQPKLLKTEKHQTCLLDLKGKVYELFKRFSWIKQLYFESLNLKATRDLLKGNLENFYTADVLLPKFLSFWKQLNLHPSSKDLNEDLLVGICFYIVEDLKSRTEERQPKQVASQQKNFCFDCMEICLTIVVEMKTYAESKHRRPELIKYGFNMLDIAMKYAQQTDFEEKETTALFPDVEKLKKELVLVANFLVRDVHAKKCLDVASWNCLAEIQWNDKAFNNLWNDNAHMKMVEVTKRVFRDPLKLIDYYCGQFESSQPHKIVSEWLTEIVVDRFVKFAIDQNEKQSVEQEWTKVQKSFKKKKNNQLFQANVVSVCVKVLKKQWKNRPKYDGGNRLKFLEFVQNWNTLFLDSLTENKLCDELPSEVKDELVSIDKNLLKVLNDLQYGQITVECLQKLKEIKSNFYSCLETIQTTLAKKNAAKMLSQNDFFRFVKIRIEELDKYYETITAITNLVDFFTSITEGIMIIRCKETTSMLARNIAPLRLGALVTCRPTNVRKSKTEEPQVLSLDLSASDLSLVMELQKNKVLLYESKVIRYQIMNAVEKARLKGVYQVSLSEALELLWKPLQKVANEMVKKLDEETLSLKEVDDIFFSFDKKSKMTNTILANELQYICGVATAVQLKKEKKPRLLQQLEQYLSLKKSLLVAESLMDIKEMLNLGGSFSALDTIVNLMNEAQDFPLSSMKNLIAQVIDVLRLPLVEEYHVQSLRRFLGAEKLVAWLKENVKESRKVKDMIDLAMVAAGEVPMEIERVSCLSSAVMGFSPLVFDVQPDDGFDALLKACEAVWDNVANDRNVPSILDNWEEAGKQLGWLDYMQSFQGSVEKSSLEKAQLINSNGLYVIKCQIDDIPTVENSIELRIMETDSEMKMTLSDLRDLQSRLMLIAGESSVGKNDVTRFIKILSCVENLTKTYLKLKTFGCSLFADWSAQIRSSEQETKCVTVEVYFYENSPSLTSSYNVVEEMLNLIVIMNDAYSQWMNYLTENRNKHYHLNHFNIQQLTYLCRELASNAAADYNEQVYQLLASVLPFLNKNDIAECLIQATAEINDRSVDNIVEEENSKSKIPGFAVIQNMMKNGLDLTFKNIIDQMHATIATEKSSLSSVMKMICQVYFKGTAVTSLKDCLSLKHCGKFLTHLSNRRNPASLPRRDWAGCFVEGKPNLLICRRPKNLLLMLLSLYMHSSNQGFPTASEVVLCSEETSAEDVELLFRRAVLTNNDADQIYCLANADLLSFNVSKKAEECFESLMKMDEKNENFKLVILTCNEQHYLTSCFHEHKIEGFNMAKKANMQVYIKKYLSTKNNAICAAKIDENCSSTIVVRSGRSGMGKSLYISRCCQKLQDVGVTMCSTIRLLEKSVDVDDVVMTLQESGKNNGGHFAHVDITPSVQAGKSKLLFELFILGRIQNSRGVVWRRLPCHLYMLEYTKAKEQVDVAFSKFLNLLPTMTCLSPDEIRNSLQQNPNQRKPTDQVFMDAILLESEMYQRPFQYLRRYRAKENLDNFIYQRPILDGLKCLSTLLQYCSVESPSWSELSHFAKFLNAQLLDCEKSYFVNADIVGAEFQGFKHFVVHFMIKMSQDFATPSLQSSTDISNVAVQEQVQEVVQKTNEQLIYEKFCQGLRVCYHGVMFILFWAAYVVRKMLRSSEVDDDDSDDDDDDELPSASLLELHQLQRRWESSFHPYVFFNADRHSMSFANFNVNNQGTLCHPKTKQEVERNLMRPELVQALTRNFVDLQQDIDKMTRQQKLAILRQVFGVEDAVDPDNTYELTSDNVVKMLAIQMRFRCGIPVVMMGETGCGKTRMVDFMSKLKAAGNPEVQNMVVVKVHGGVTASMVQQRVEEAIELAMQNKHQNVEETILFLDEANTTEAIYAIKEIMCDETVRGKSFADTGLRIVAACNPYRAHPPEVIEAMEKSGLGFHVKPNDVSDTFDDIPMRHLVYRVIALPPSMRPLVWDFGQLSNETEEVYINQMVARLQHEINRSGNLPQLTDSSARTITKVVAASQAYMRSRYDICNFVSLRDAERTMQSFRWFYEQLPILNPLIQQQKIRSGSPSIRISDCIRALIQALSVCYYVSLRKRKAYRELLAREIFNRRSVEKIVLDEIIACQNVFIRAIQLESNIACNEALRENVFMMVICAEMRIPLFLVGKPGSSKSLAKTIVTDAMQGTSSRSELYRNLKEIHVLSFQCSAVTDAVGIEAVFRQCAQLQKKKDIRKYVAMVVLDEIGLAEDSKKMPLKVLHPLLETASTTSTSNVENHQRVGFVGISNWALDPAKMNRGIFVTRGKPTNEDLHKTAVAIFESDQEKLENVSLCIKAVTDAYLEIYDSQTKEFFGLRDYYSMMKMLYTLSGTKRLTFSEVGLAVIRNFSGASLEVLSVFQKHCEHIFHDVEFPSIPVKDLICSNLNPEIACRFLMILTKQYSAVNLLPEILGNRDYVVVFGSSFPHDHDYTEVCRNINKIKVCMETGRTVVLLNLRDLYESLYDALNQHYVTLAGQRYVDLGLGGHRVKCRVASDFKLIVIEEKEVVYKEYPIPLINRLEKHVFEMSSVLTDEEKATVLQLKNWVASHCAVGHPFNLKEEIIKQNTFLGYNEDSCASALLSSKDRSFESAQKILLQTATLDGICRLPRAMAQENFDSILKIYMNDQIHDSLWMYLQEELKHEQISIREIVSFSQVLNEKDRQVLLKMLNLPSKNLLLLTLQQFQTELQFSERIVEFMENVYSHGQHFVLLIQCSQAHKNNSLIACAKYATSNIVEKFQKKRGLFNGSLSICFLLTLERRSSLACSTLSYVNFYSRNCSTIYIDELKPDTKVIGSIGKLWDMSIYDIIVNAIDNVSSEHSPVNIKQLIRESIPLAMAKLQNRVENFSSTRVRLMLSLCFEGPVFDTFFAILLKKIQTLLEDRETKSSTREEWIIEQACCSRSLQEGGTFTSVLWLKLKTVVSIALAKIISVADADDNLQLLQQSVAESRDIADLWFQMFDRNELWDLQWTSMSMNEESVFFVDGVAGFSCSFPFSRFIFDLLRKDWMLLKEANVEDQHKMFFRKMETSSISWLLDTAEEIGVNAVKCFSHDLVCMMYKPRSFAENHCFEFAVVQAYVFSIYQKLRKNQQLLSNPFIEIFVMLIENKKNLRTFAELVEIFPTVTSDPERWANVGHTETFCLHHKAFEMIVTQLFNTAIVSFNDIENCVEWMSRVAKLSFLSQKFIPHADKVVQERWHLLSFIHMFLEELLPVSTQAENMLFQYLQILSIHARKLWADAINVDDLSDLIVLKRIVETINLCKEDLRLYLLCNWGEIGCIVCKTDKMKQPVILPCCQSFLCLKCATKKDTLRCPYCERCISQTNILQPLQLTVLQQKEFNDFSSACTSFFLEYLSTFCFPVTQDSANNTNFVSPAKELFSAVEELVVNDDQNKAALDLDHTARSYILQLLLRSDERLVEQQLIAVFEKMARILKDRTALLGVYINCKQDYLRRQYIDSNALSNREPNIVFAYTLLLEATNRVRNVSSFNQLNHLQTCAQLQFVAKVAISCMMQMVEERAPKNQLQEITTFMNAICRKCEDPAFMIFRQFIIKCLCRRYGTDALNIMLENDLFRKLVPENLLPQAGEEKDSYFHADRLCLTGERYRRTKTLLLDIAQESDEKRVLQQVSGAVNMPRDDYVQVLLATSVWVAYDCENPSRKRTFQAIHRKVPRNLRSSVFEDIAQGCMEALKCTEAGVKRKYALTELLHHFAVRVSTSQDQLILFFKTIMEKPNSVQRKFLPTMPGTDYSAVREAMKNKEAYLCPNGHPYYIGECGRAWVAATCPECGSAIGGKRHNLEKDNLKGEITEESQAGYKTRKTTAAVPERKLSKVSVCATRICLHLAMLLGCRNGENIARMVHRNGGDEVDFLFEEIQFDLKEISKLLGRGVDDAFMLLHLLFNRMKTTQSTPNGSCNWNSMHERERWEEEFQTCFLNPVFSNSTKFLNQAQNVMISAGKLVEKPLERLVYELKKDDALPDGLVPWNTPCLWKYMIHVDVNHLRQTLESVSTSSKFDGAALKLIINCENVEVIQHLFTVVALQCAFIKRYGQKIDMMDAENTTVDDFLAKESFVYEREVETYIQVWNKVKSYAFNADRYTISPSYLEEDMSRDSPISMCLPSRRGRGLCAFILADYLMEKQNDLLLACRELVEPKPSLKTIDVEDLDSNDLICINSMEDLMPIVLENSQYETTVTDNGIKHNISYNLGLLQKKILHKYIFGKCIINKETLPSMKYPQDMGLSKDFQTIQMRGNQVPLPLKLCQEVDDLIENCLTAKLCEVVRTLTLVVQFLAKNSNIHADRQVFEFAEKELLLPLEETEMIPRSALISHCLGFYERLSWHRSKRLIQNGQDPFENVKNAEDITDLLIVENLKRAFVKIKVHLHRLQLEINAILLFGPSMDPEWRLANDVLLPYLELKDEGDTSWCEQIPDDILFKHALHVFNLSLEYAN